MQPSTRRRNARVTSSASRATRSKASAPAAQKKMTSAGKAAGRTPTVDNRAQRAKVSTATVTRSGGGTPGSAKVTTGQGGVKPPRGGAQAMVAGEVMRARPVADGTLKGKPTGPQKGPSVPERLKKENPYKEGTFNHAFKAARNSNYKTFTWNGKKYTTDMK